MPVKKTFFLFQFLTLPCLRFDWPKTNYRIHGFMFSSPLKKALDVFVIQLVMFEIQQFPNDKFL
jgi:hypothetical protein